MDSLKRRASDKTGLDHLRDVLLNGDISMLLLVAAFGLAVWAAMGVFVYSKELEAFSALFPYGSAHFWTLNYSICSISLVFIVMYRFPPLFSLLAGSWITIIYSWITFARAVGITTLQTGVSSSIVYILIGLLIINRSAKR